MMDRQSLREFQARLTERLRSASAGAYATRLGFLVGDRRCLVDLAEIHEMVPSARIVPVPWAKPWFLGLTGIRGVVYGCTDLAAFLGHTPNAGPAVSPLLLVHPRFGVPAALLVGRVLGLRRLEDLRREDAAAGQPWANGVWQDEQGDRWLELSIERLVTSPAFLEAGS